MLVQTLKHRINFIAKVLLVLASVSTIAYARIDGPIFNPASVALTGGTINGTPIGGTTPAAVAGTTLSGTTLSLSSNVTMTGVAGGTRYYITTEDGTGTGRVVLQAGGGSAGYGGAINLYANTHATHPGDVVAGLSNGSAGCFRVNTSGIDNGTTIFSACNGAVTTTGTITGTTINGTSGMQINGVALKVVLSGTTPAIGGGALLAGACASDTVAVTSSTTAMSVSVTPVTYPGDGVTWSGYVSSAGTVTVKVCGIIAVTPTSSTYNVRVLQ